jgi:hypothetical protein
MVDRQRVPAPSDGAEIVRFAIHLGMDLRDDVHLLWIAEEALRAPLPEHWEATVDQFGRPQYKNKINQSVSLEHPMDEYYRYLYLKKKLESDASFLSSMVADSKSSPKKNSSIVLSQQSGYQGIQSPEPAAALTTGGSTSLREMQEVDSLIENQNALRKNIMLSKSKLSGLLDSGFKISADLDGKKGEDLTALFNPIYFLDKHEEPSQYASRVWRSDLKEAQHQLHAMELDLQDVEKEIKYVQVQITEQKERKGSQTINDSLAKKIIMLQKKRRSLEVEVKNIASEIEERKELNARDTQEKSLKKEDDVFLTVPLTRCRTCRSAQPSRCPTHNMVCGYKLPNGTGKCPVCWYTTHEKKTCDHCHSKAEDFWGSFYGSDLNAAVRGFPSDVSKLSHCLLQCPMCQATSFPLIAGRMTSDIDGVIVIYGTFDEVPQKHWWGNVKHKDSCTLRKDSPLNKVSCVLDIDDLILLCEEILPSTIRHRLRRLRDWASTSIRCAWKANRARKILTRRLVERSMVDQWMTRIQRLWRGFWHRRHYKRLRVKFIKDTKAVIKIQCSLRLHQAKTKLQRQRAELDQRILIASFLQKRHRGKVTRKVYTPKLEERRVLTRFAKKIQMWFRSARARKILKFKKSSAQRRFNAVVVMQNFYRKWKSNKQLMIMWQSTKASDANSKATAIQRVFRGYAAKRDRFLKELANERRTMVVVHFLRFLSFKRWRVPSQDLDPTKREYMMIRAKSFAALVIQNWWKRMVTRRGIQDAYGSGGRVHARSYMTLSDVYLRNMKYAERTLASSRIDELWKQKEKGKKQVARLTGRMQELNSLPKAVSLNRLSTAPQHYTQNSPVKNSTKYATRVSEAITQSKEHVRIMDPGIRPLTVEDFHRMRARREELKSELMSIQALMNATASQVKQHKLKATVLPAVSKPKFLAAVAPKVASSTVKSPTMLVAISFPKKNATPHRANK